MSLVFPREYFSSTWYNIGRLKKHRVSEMIISVLEPAGKAMLGK